MVVEHRGLCGALYAMFEHGFKKKKFFSTHHIWDFLSRIAKEDDSPRLASDPHSIYSATVVQAASMGIPKTARVQWLFCVAATNHICHVFFTMVGLVPVPLVTVRVFSLSLVTVCVFSLSLSLVTVCVFSLSARR